MSGLLLPAAGVAALGLILGLVLAFVSKRMEVAEDESFYEVRSLLPGINCGACGFTGCDDYAKHLLTGAPINLCQPGGAGLVHELADALGQSGDVAIIETSAIVHCRGTNEATARILRFDGPQSCEAANALYRGHGECSYGCLGYGDCAAACPYGAIMVDDGVAVVNPKLCVSCGRCIPSCPKKLIDFVPKNTLTFVGCSSLDRGAVTRKTCNVGCIACKLCEKACEYDAIKVENNLAYIDYKKCTNCGACKKACPTNAVRDAIKPLWEREVDEKEAYII